MDKAMKDKIAKSMLSEYSSRLYDALDYVEDENSRIKLEVSLQSLTNIINGIEWEKETK